MKLAFLWRLDGVGEASIARPSRFLKQNTRVMAAASSMTTTAATTPMTMAILGKPLDFWVALDTDEQADRGKPHNPLLSDQS